MIEALSRTSLVAGGLSSGSAAQAAPTPAADFGSMLNSMSASAVSTIRAGEEAAAAGIIGAMPVQQVVDKILAAERTLQTTLAIRDKMVSAYLEISRMQI